MNNRKPIDVIVISQLPPPVHGSTIMTRTFLAACENAGLTVSLIDRRFSTSVDEIGATSVRKVLSGVSLFTRLWRGLARRRSASVVFFTTNRGPSFWMDVILSALLRIKRRAYIAYIHTSGYSELADSGPLQKRGVRVILGGASAVVVLGESMREDVRRFSDTVEVIPNTVDDQGTTVEPSIGSPQLVFMSNLIPGKGAEDFMRIASHCLAEEPAARAVVIGGSANASYIDALRSMLDDEVRPRVCFAGALYDDEKDHVIGASSVLVFPSTYQFEAQPLTLLESLRLAVPVVAYDVGGIKDVVKQGTNGYLVAMNDWRSASERCLEILRSERLRLRLSEGARDTFNLRFSAKQYRKAWQSLLVGRD